MTTIELARFRIREGAEAGLPAERPAMVAALGRRFPACLARVGGLRHVEVAAAWTGDADDRP